jgi:hypothetical protein
MSYVLAPDGRTVVQVPEGQLEAVLADGGTLLAEREVSDRNQRQSMQQRFFEQEWKRKKKQPFRLNRPRYR